MEWLSVKNQFKQTWLTTLMSLILFAGVTCFLFWSESQTIKNNLVLEEIVSSASSIDVHLNDDASNLQSRIVHIIGPLQILEPIIEPDYNIEVLAVKLRKRVQMYQWIEESTDQETFLSEPGDESQKSYWYHKDWRDYIVESSLFSIRPGHQNPTSMPIGSETRIADSVKIGSLFLGLDVKRKVNDYYEIWSDSRPDRGDIKLHSGFYYHGESALEHQIGDLRVHFSYAGRHDDIYTAIGIVESGTLQPYTPTSSSSVDGVALLRKGSFSLKQLHDLEKKDANIHTWKYRLLGFVQVFVTFATLHPDWLSIFRQSSWISPSFRRSQRLWCNFILSICVATVIISIPWLIHKPSVGLLVLCGGIAPMLHYSTLLTRNPTPPTPVRRRSDAD